MRNFAFGIRAISRSLARAELFACQLLIVFFTSLLLVNVIGRYAFNRPFYFAEELAVYILIWMAFLAISVTIARNEMIRLTFLVDLLSPRLRRIIDIVVETLLLVMLVAIAVAAFRWIVSPAVVYSRALTLGMTKLPFLTIVPIFTVLATFHVASNLLTMAVLPEEEAGIK